MPANEEPQIAGAPERQCEDDANHRNADSAYRTFTFVREVHSAKAERKNPRGGPESNPIRQSELQIAAECKLFKKSDHNKKNPPKDTPLKNCAAMDIERTKRVAVKDSDAAHEGSDFNDA